MKTIEIIGQDLFDKIRSRFTNLQMGDEEGAVTMDPRQARFYDFDFTIEGNNLGRVSISINELGTLKVFYGKSLLEDSDPISRDMWYDFLREMRMFAKRRLLRFDTRDITKSNLNKDDFQYLASNGPKDEFMNMNESTKFEGSSKTSRRMLEKTKLVIKHKDRVNMEDAAARTRANNIKAIYIENEEGERFKYPFIHVGGAKAMQMHCAHGGRPYDEKGASIIKMSEQMAQLSGFKRHLGRHDAMNQQVSEITDRANMKLENLRSQMHALTTRSGYQAWSESWEPLATTEGELDAATMEDYKSKFSITSFKEDLAQYFPLLHSIMQEAGTIDLEDFVGETGEKKCNECGMLESQCSCEDEEVKEGMFSKFVEWADAITEGTLEPDAIMKLSELLQGNPELTVGADGTSGVEALEGIGIVVDALESLIEAKAKIDPNTLLADVVAEWMVKDDPQAAQEMGFTAPAEAPVEEPVEPVSEEVEDSTSYKVARYLFDKGLRYKPENENDIIKMIGGAMMKMGMNHKQVRYLMSYDEDFLSDTLSQLHHMEKALDEVGIGEGADMDKIPAYVRKQKQQSQQAGDDATEKRNQAAGAKVWRNPRAPNESEDEDEMHGSEGGQEKPSIKELAQWLQGFYNKDYQEQGFDSPWRKGTTELATMAKKQFGDNYGSVVERMISDMFETPLARIHREGGIRNAEKHDNEAEMINQSPASKSPFTKVDNPPLPKGPEEEQFEAILRLAGLAK